MSSELKTNKISPATGTALTLADSGDTLTLPSGATLDIASGATLTNSGTATGFGKVLQVLQATKNDIASTTSTTFADVSGLSVSITPSSTSNKILVFATVMTSNGFGSSAVKLNLLRDSTILGEGSTGTEKASIVNYGYTHSSALNWLDSPSTTSSTTYKIQFATDSGNVIYVNRNAIDANYTGSSSITVMEISA